MQKNKKLYFVFKEPEDAEELGYHAQYDSIQEALEDNCKEAEILTATLKPIGKFRLVTKPVRIKKRKVKK